LEKFKLVDGVPFDYFKIGCMYLSKILFIQRYVLGCHLECLKVPLYQLPYVLKQPRTKKAEKKSQAGCGNTKYSNQYGGGFTTKNLLKESNR
jgi:hypothetical protein